MLGKGTFEIVGAGDGFFAVLREYEDHRMFVAFNLSDKPCKVDLPGGDWMIDANAPFDVTETEDGLELPGWQVLFAHEGG